MAKDTYTVQWKEHGLFGKKVTLDNVKDHWPEDLCNPRAREQPEYQMKNPLYMVVLTEDDEFHFIPATWYFRIFPDRAQVILNRMSKETGQQVQRA